MKLFYWCSKKNIGMFFCAYIFFLSSLVESSSYSPRSRNGKCEGALSYIGYYDFADGSAKIPPHMWGYYKCSGPNCGKVTLGAPIDDSARVRCHDCEKPRTFEKSIPYPSTAHRRVPKSDEHGWGGRDYEHALRGAGPAWNCGRSNCRARNFGAKTECVECGTPKPEATQAEDIRLQPLQSAVEVVQERFAPKAPARENEGPLERSVRVVETPKTHTEHRANSNQESTPNFVRKNALYIAGSGLLVLGGVAAYQVTPGEKEVGGELSHLEWSRSVIIQNFEKVTRRARRDSIRVRNVRLPVSGLNEEPGAFNVRNCEDGFCDYDTYVWKTVYEKKLSGADSESDPLHWPDRPLEKTERRVVSQNYSVKLSFTNNEKEYQVLLPVEDPAVFDSMKEKEKVHVLIGDRGEAARIRRENGQLLYIREGAH